MSSLTRISGPLFDIDFPKNWVAEPVAVGPLGTLLTASGDGHVLRVERVLDGLVPVDSLMSHVSFLSRQGLDGYEPADAESCVVFGAGPAAKRIAVTDEGEGGRFVQLELFAEGYDQCMWYVRVSAPRAQFDSVLAELIVDSLQIRFLAKG
jgi:hypothetical protein